MKYGRSLLIAIALLGSGFTLVLPNTTQAAGVCYYYDINVGSKLPIPPGNIAPNINGNCPSYNGQPGSAVNTVTGTDGTVVPNNLSYTPLEPIPGQAGAPATFCATLNLLFKVLIYLGGMIAVLFLVLGGIAYMVSEVVDKRTAARERIKSSVIGLLILLGTYLILFTVNPNLVNTCNTLNGTQTGVYYPNTPNISTAATIQKAKQDCEANNGVNTGSVITVPPQDLANRILFPTQSCDDLRRNLSKQTCNIIATDNISGSTLYCVR